MPNNLHGSKSCTKDWLLLWTHTFVRMVTEKNIHAETTSIKTKKLRNIDIRILNCTLLDKENKNKCDQNLKGN